MNKIPFSVYDYFGYLASGFLLIFVLDYAIGEQWLLLENTPIGLWLVGIVVAYIIGQIIANPSAWLFERIIVNKWLKSPVVNLLRELTKTWLKRLFPGYFTPFPIAIRKKVMEKAKVNGITEPTQSLFIHAFGEVKKDGNAIARLNTFLNLYGFCRNISFVSLLAFLILIATSWGSWGNLDRLPWAFAALVCSIGMFYRYLKFYRQYSYELFITYIALPSEDINHGD